MGGKLQCLQTGALRLNDPVDGVSGGPAHVQRQLANSRYQAASQMFQTAIREQVELVLLVGDTQGVQVPGSRAPWFLHQQFTALARHGIGVVVRADDLPAVPNGLAWPSNVHLISADCPAVLRLRRGESVRVCDDRGRIDFSLTETHHIVLAQALPETLRIERQPPAYWASGGDQQVHEQQHGKTHSLAAGRLQAEGFTESNACGALLVTLHTDRAVETRFCPCDAVRWQHAQLVLNADSSMEGICHEIIRRGQELSTAAVLTVLRWELTGEGPLLERLWSRRERQPLLEAVRHRDDAHVWVAEISATLPEEHRLESHSQAGEFVTALGIAQDIERQLAACEIIDLLSACRLSTDEVPRELRNLSRHRYHDRLQSPLAQQLHGELFVAARSA